MPQRPIVRFLVLIGVTSIGCNDLPKEAEGVGTRSMPVVGGVPAEVGDYPSTVSLMMKQGGKWESGCTGTLVAPTVVITAAHCLEDWWGTPLSINEIRIVYGYTNPQTAPSSELRTLASLHPHPNYAPNASTDSDGLGKTNDIGVVVLNEPIANGVTTPILPENMVDSVLVPGSQVHVVGYGINNINTWASGILYKAITPYIRHISWEMLAGSPGNPDSCNGDSGGPAYMEVGGALYLVGVTSRAWKKSQKMCGDGGIYTIASAHLTWLEGVVGNLDAGVSDITLDVSHLDASESCLPLTSRCHPMTNEGCDSSAGEACKVTNGAMTCQKASNDVQEGGLCDQTSRFCAVGLHCGSTFRCQRVCCSDADCPQGGPCLPISGTIGSLGTCEWVKQDASPDVETDSTTEAAADAMGGAGGAAGQGGMAGQGGVAGQGGMAANGGAAGSGQAAGHAGDGNESRPPKPSAEEDDEGCGCRTAGSRSVGTPAWLAALGLGLLLRRRQKTL
ncbi:MAG TPA: trypsin-like serine protease [Polyangiaceae bacterium]|nr:MAG: Trypsin [Deltaproteobacteria bacterium ADurb.Bin207]HNS97622.1 trypsin-like serine protease [Polyangiaceae bacterium]HNZ24118.1 trypsin-like serine protease [Polyangiaceae bacterium]HOD23588.1 trypsin-like serine protease [Polyangiaceae bacterium]HOH02200.1 trypsin-like serine protease [Polyangiaceae bacterium]